MYNNKTWLSLLLSGTRASSEGYTSQRLKVEGKKRKKLTVRSSLAVQWLGLWAFIAKGLGSFPGRWTSHASHTVRPKTEKKWREKYWITVDVKKEEEGRRWGRREADAGCGNARWGLCPHSAGTCGHNPLQQETDAPNPQPPDPALSVRSWKIVNKCHHKPPQTRQSRKEKGYKGECDPEMKLSNIHMEKWQVIKVFQIREILTF